MEPESSKTTAIRADECHHTDVAHNVLAVFVVQFDIHKGNVIEWQYPTDFDLEGVEFQAICSGLHRIPSDVIYFSRQNMYGISVFQNIPTESNRGSHMKAIGIIVQPTHNTGICGKVWNHEHFLKRELSKYMVITEEDSNRYASLLEYYTHYQYQEEEDHTVPFFHYPSLNYYSVNYNLKHNVVKETLKQEFGADTFAEFVHTFGPDVFVLWKAALLRKRIMLINIPPMEIACNYVYNIHLLGKIPPQFQNSKNDIIPKFTVGVNDIPQLEKKNQAYVACTPDSIFQIKSDLYDMLITLPPISPMNRPNFKSNVISTKHNSADFTRFHIMWKQLMSSSSTSWAEYLASEPNGIIGTTSAFLTGICYWLYEKPHETSTISSKIYTSWQKLFAGSSHDNNNQLPIFLNQTSTTDESQNLLFDEDEEDAMEINNNEVFSAVQARESNEVYSDHDMDVLVKEDNEIILGFFHSLTYFLLSTLKTILSVNEEDNSDIIYLYPKDMVQLGLDPINDIDFIIQLSNLYFRKKVIVRGIHNPQACMSLCCCQPFKKKDSNNGSIRI